jgi:hypothetical protein
MQEETVNDRIGSVYAVGKEIQIPKRALKMTNEEERFEFRIVQKYLKGSVLDKFIEVFSFYGVYSFG